MSAPTDPEPIFYEARKLTSQSEREAYLSEACGQDVALRTMLDVLLAADTRDSGLFAEADEAPMISCKTCSASDVS